MTLPAGKYSYKKYVYFTKVGLGLPGITGDVYGIIGPADQVVPDAPCKVITKEGKEEWVVPLQILGEREVLKRTGEKVLYRLCSFDRCIDETQPDPGDYDG